MHWLSLDLVAVFFGLIYIWRAVYGKWDAWVAGIISSLIWAYVSFYSYRLYADAVLQLFYVILGFYGLYQWYHNDITRKSVSSYSLMSSKEHITTILFTILASAIWYYFLSVYTKASLPMLDTVTTCLALINTYWLTKKRLDNWLYWILVNAIYIYIYSSTRAWLFVFISVIYLGMSILAFYRWRGRTTIKEHGIN